MKAINEMTFGQLLDKLAELEDHKFDVIKTVTGQHALVFRATPQSGDDVDFNNISMLCQWADHNGKTVFLSVSPTDKESALWVYVIDKK